MSFLRGDATILGGSINNTPIGATTASTGRFTTVDASGVITSTVTTGTAPLTVASTTRVANLYATTTKELGTTGASVDVASSAPPTTGQILTATSATTAEWQTPSSSAFKTPVRAATTTNGTLATDFENGDTIDGVVLATGDRILLKDQTSGVENGLYIVNATGAPTRAADLPTGSGAAGAFVVCAEGTQNADTMFLCTNDEGSDIVGTDALTWIPYGVPPNGKPGGQTIAGGTGTGENLTLVANSANTTTGTVAITTTTGSTSTTSGALTVAGGVGISENLYVGGDLNVQGNIIQTGSTAESYEAFSLDSSVSANQNPLLTKTVSYVTITGGSGTATGTLADGTTIGQFKRIVLIDVAAGSTFDLTVTNAKFPMKAPGSTILRFNSINLDDAGGMSVSLTWNGSVWLGINQGAEVI